MQWDNNPFLPLYSYCKICTKIMACKYDDRRRVWLCMDHYAHENLDDMLSQVADLNPTSHPSGIECIQIIEHMNFCLGNVTKYVWRADNKNGLEDLKKAQWYLNREIERRVHSK